MESNNYSDVLTPIVSSTPRMVLRLTMDPFGLQSSTPSSLDATVGPESEDSDSGSFITYRNVSCSFTTPPPRRLATVKKSKLHSNRIQFSDLFRLCPPA